MPGSDSCGPGDCAHTGEKTPGEQASALTTPRRGDGPTTPNREDNGADQLGDKHACVARIQTGRRRPTILPIRAHALTRTPSKKRRHETDEPDEDENKHTPRDASADPGQGDQSGQNEPEKRLRRVEYEFVCMARENAGLRRQIKDLRAKNKELCALLSESPKPTTLRSDAVDYTDPQSFQLHTGGRGSPCIADNETLDAWMSGLLE